MNLVSSLVSVGEPKAKEIDRLENTIDKFNSQTIIIKNGKLTSIHKAATNRTDEGVNE